MTDEHPKDRYCLACGNVVNSTEKHFREHGHTDDPDYAVKRYGMTPAQIDAATKRARSLRLLP